MKTLFTNFIRTCLCYIAGPGNLAILLWVLSSQLLFAQVQLTADLVPQACSSAPKGTVVLQGKLYFNAHTAATGEELFMYDPATRQASLVADLIPGAQGSAPESLVAMNGKLYFIAQKIYDVYFTGLTPFPVLYELDPATDSIRLVDSFLCTGSGASTGSTLVRKELKQLNGKFYLYVLSDCLEPFVLIVEYDPVDPASSRLVHHYISSNFSLLVFYNDLVYYSDQGIWYVYDPQTAVPDEPVRLNGYLGGYATGISNTLYFNGYSTGTGYELYAYDIAAESVTLVSDIYPGTGSGNPSDLTVLDGKLYFRALTPATGEELFVHDPVSGTTGVAADIRPGNTGSSPRRLFSFGNRLYFSATKPAKGRELFQYDPATQQATLVADIAPDTVSGNPTSFAGLDEKLYFSVYTETLGTELWETTQGSGIKRFVLLDALHDVPIAVLENNDVIDLDSLDLYHYGIKINPEEEVVKVDFKLEGPVQATFTDDSRPFSLYGDTAGDYQAAVPVAGTYILTATPYIIQDSMEVAQDHRVVYFTFSAGELQASNIRLVQASTGEELQPLTDNSELFQVAIPEEDISVLVDVPDPGMNSVWFELSRNDTLLTTTLQNDAPYALFGKHEGMLLPDTLTAGTYTLKIITYLQQDRQGYGSEPVVIRFTVRTDPYKIRKIPARQSNARVIDVSIDGNSAVMLESVAERQEYSAYTTLLVNQNDQWSFTDDVENWYSFGFYGEVALENNNLVINKMGAILFYDSVNTGTLNNVFQYGTWSPYVIPDLYSVALDGTRAVSSGALVFEQRNGSWRYITRLVPSGVTLRYSTPVALDGNTIMLSYENAVYVFMHNNGAWQQTQTIPTPGFVSSLAIEGNYALLGADVYHFGNGEWTKTATLTPSDGHTPGSYVDLDGNHAAVSAKDAAYIFRLTDGEWQEVRALYEPEDNTGPSFGYPLDLNGTSLMVGAGNAAYVYTLFELQQDGVCNRDVVLTSQAEADACKCTVINGNLTIAGSDITNLDRLSALTMVNGKLVIENNPVLNNIGGLSSLTYADRLVIRSNASLTHLDGLSALNRIGDNLNIRSNAVLENIDGLGSITSLANVDIRNNPSLQNIDGLSPLTNASVLILDNNGALENVDGLASLIALEHLQIANNISIENCCGLYNLWSSGNVTGHVTISNNGALCTREEVLADCGGHEAQAKIASGRTATARNADAAENNVRIYPNPTENGKLFITAAHTGERGWKLVLRDAMGRTVANWSVNGSESYTAELDLNSLPAGLYYLTIDSGTATVSEKIIKR